MPSGDGFPPLDSHAEWLRGGGAAADIVLSSRVRLARNLAGVPFARKASAGDAAGTLDVCKRAILGGGLADKVLWINVHELPATERMLLVERHLISKQLARGQGADPAGKAVAKAGKGAEPARAVAVTLPHERVAIMVNEEDHLRLQSLRSGLALSEAWEEIDRIDDRLESMLDYAFSPRFGYLTACPTNVGTGLRMSVMLHLPALKLTGDIEKVKRAAADMNLAVRGFYGEGSDATGDFYQISNQTTLGKAESAILHELEGEIIPRVIEYERLARETLKTRRTPVLEDHVFRALGTLLNARLMTTEESMQHLSHLRLGVVTGLLPQFTVERINRLMLLTQPIHLQRTTGREADQDQRRTLRAQLLRTDLANVS